MTRSQRGAQLRKERLRLKLSTFRLAIRANLHPRTIELAERGASSAATLEKIAAALGAPEAPTP